MESFIADQRTKYLINLVNQLIDESREFIQKNLPLCSNWFDPYLSNKTEPIYSNLFPTQLENDGDSPFSTRDEYSPKKR